MRVLVVYAHPDPDSYCAAIHATVLDALRRGGHDVDSLDLYAEGFDPVLTLEERRAYHRVPANREPVAGYVERLERAEGLVLVHPVWNFGMPAIMKGFLDRVFLPGVSFRIVKGKAAPNLRQVRFLAGVATYGASRWRTAVMGDPPRRIVTRMLRVLAAPRARVVYLPLHDMNRATDLDREVFLARVARTFKAVR